ncbi:hypothetical protein ILUMI_02452, partial [Ignelater luminosus]
MFYLSLVSQIILKCVVENSLIFYSFFSDYLDPFLSETWGNTGDVMGFRSVLKLTPTHPRNPHYRTVCEQIKASSTKPPFCVPYHHKIFDSIS